jgi:hypothetical protein
LRSIHLFRYVAMLEKQPMISRAIQERRAEARCGEAARPLQVDHWAVKTRGRLCGTAIIASAVLTSAL